MIFRPNCELSGVDLFFCPKHWFFLFLLLHPYNLSTENPTKNPLPSPLRPAPYPPKFSLPTPMPCALPIGILLPPPTVYAISTEIGKPTEIVLSPPYTLRHIHRNWKTHRNPPPLRPTLGKPREQGPMRKEREGQPAQKGLEDLGLGDEEEG